LIHLKEFTNNELEI